MVVLNDFQKILLYKKLNLGFDCDVCYQRFYGKQDLLKHIQEQHPSKGLECKKCGKHFGHQQILQLHLQIHALSEACAKSSPNYSNVLQISDVPVSDQSSEEPSCLQNLPVPTSNVKSLISQQSKKQVGLTKVKMEDCLRCDACSCIYIDKQDYYKHMRNFHQISVDNSPIPNRPKRKCRSCCKHCRGTHSVPHKRPRMAQYGSNLIFRYSMQDNIKDRWSKISQRLTEAVEEVHIKQDLDEHTLKLKQETDTGDLSDFLSKVEVKIKTEPSEVYE